LQNASSLSAGDAEPERSEFYELSVLSFRRREEERRRKGRRGRKRREEKRREHRTITCHTFTNFLLFSVQTDQAIGKPQNP